MSSLKIFGEADDRTLEQAENCLAVEEDSHGVLCADNHLGYAQPVGMAIAYRDHVSVSGVGYDIGCGNKAIETNLQADDIDVAGVMDEIARRVSFGIGPNKGEKAPDHSVLDEIREADWAPQRQLLDKAANQLGTVGAGNHYVDLFADEGGKLWIGVHFGSRGFGHKTATEFIEAAGAKDDIMASPAVLPIESALGQGYIAAMELAGRYAYAGRDVVCDRVLDILGAESVFEVHNHHNFAWRETHFGEKYWVVRKGCTPAFPGQLGFVGATMGEDSVILAGADDPDALTDQQQALYSTVHGAGRAMSRTEAAGKRRKRWACSRRNCDWVQQPSTHKPKDGKCPKCGTDRMQKIWVQEKEGKVDWELTLGNLAIKGIELRGGAADEAPPAYKRLTSVLASQGDTINVVQTLRPIGVAMAGADTFDPFKD